MTRPDIDPAFALDGGEIYSLAHLERLAQDDARFVDVAVQAAKQMGTKGPKPTNLASAFAALRSEDTPTGKGRKTVLETVNHVARTKKLI